MPLLVDLASMHPDALLVASVNKGGRALPIGRHRGRHRGRHGTHEDVGLQRDQRLDPRANAITAVQTTDFTAIATETGFANPWLLFDAYLDSVAQTCSDFTLETWGGVLGGADLITKGYCDRLVESLRID